MIIMNENEWLDWIIVAGIIFSMIVGVLAALISVAIQKYNKRKEF